jgi:DNA-directed RNA polymerase specialized sigma24 family protein
MLPLAKQTAPSFEAALADHGPAVWGLCRRCCPDPDDAFQEILAHKATKQF